jgi:hypothetical protein
MKIIRNSKRSSGLRRAAGYSIDPPGDPDLARATGNRQGPQTSHQNEGAGMKILQVVPKPGSNSKLKTLLKATERTLRGPHTTFQRVREGRWKHVKYPGWIQWDQAPGGLLVAEIQTRVKDHEW